MIDAVQLEQANEPSEFFAGDPVEIGIVTGRYGNVFDASEPMQLTVNASNHTEVDAQATVQIEIRDFFDQVVAVERKQVNIPAKKTIQENWPLGIADTGYYKIRTTYGLNGQTYVQSMRTARIQTYKGADSPFGMNHAPSTNQLCEHMCKAGFLYAREWSMEWERIEPKPGEFHFEKADTHVNRVLSAGMINVQQLPPFPSVSWNCALPEGAEPLDVPGLSWGLCYYPPKDLSFMERYIDTVVTHYKDRIHTWEYLNEPFYTLHSLPNVEQIDALFPKLPGADFTVKDYIRLLKVFHDQVKKSDPNARTIGGIAGRPDLLSKEFFKAGGLDHLDVFNLHIYPGLRKPEAYVDQMAELLANMDATKAGRKPIWITECSYFGTDDLPLEPYVVGPGPWAANRLLRDERECAEYAIRFNAIMLAHGVDKIFYHWGGPASSDVNDDESLLESWMTAYGGAPRKLYAAQATMADLLGSAPKYAASIEVPSKPEGGKPSVYGYAFQCGSQAVLIAWAPTDDNRHSTWALDVPDAAKACSIVGAAIDNKHIVLGDSPVYITDSQMDAQKLAQACKLASADM